MYPFPSINQFRNVVKCVREQAAYQGKNEAGEVILNPAPIYPKLTFNGTVKLHGTNAAIVFKPESIEYQSRERVLTVKQDNAGFMNHMLQYETTLLNIKNFILTALNEHHIWSTLAIYGEWCGGNIQKGVAITGLPKMFVVFAIKLDDQWVSIPYAIKNVSAAIDDIENYPTWTTVIDFEHPELSQNYLSELTMQVEAQCPVGMQLGVEGIGEGVVWRCIEDPSPEYWFKVKGEKHSVSKVKTLALVDVEVITQINDFVSMAVTEERLKQGLHNLLNEKLKPFSMTSMGDFLRWVHSDVMKEEGDTLEANGIDPKKLGGPISLVAKRWYAAQLNDAVFKKTA